MGPRFSVTFTLSGEYYAVPFDQEHQADLYTAKVRTWWPEAVNVVVNDLES